MKKLAVEIGFEIPCGKGTVTRAAGVDAGKHTLAEFLCAACGKLHTARWSVVKIGGSCQECERTRKIDEFREQARTMGRFLCNEIFEMAELRGPYVTARAFGMPVPLVTLTRWEKSRRIMKRVPADVLDAIAKLADKGMSFASIVHTEMAKAYELTLAAVKMIVRRVWNAAKAALASNATITAESAQRGCLNERVQFAMEQAIAEAANNDSGVLCGDAIKFKKSGEIDGKYGFEATYPFPEVSRVISNKFTKIVDRTRQFRRDQRLNFALRAEKEKSKERVNVDRLYWMAARYNLDEFIGSESVFAA